MTEEQRYEEPDTEEVEDSPTDDSSQGKSIPIEDYKNLQAAYTKSNQDLGRMQARIEQLEASSQTEEEESETVDKILDSLDDDAIRERVDSDPAEAIPILKNALKGALGRLEGEFVSTLKQRDAYYHNQFKERDPAYQQVKDEIAKLREEEPAFQNLPDETLMAIVNRSKGGKSKSEFRGNPGDGGTPQPKPKADDVKKSDLYNRMYGDM